MAESTLYDYEYVVIHGVSPTAYERVLEAVGHCHLRHTSVIRAFVDWARTAYSQQ